jgi:surface carbohydrate biosynthesis protein
VRKSVYFLIDEVARDSIVASGVKRRLKHLGIDLYYGNRKSTSILALRSKFDEFDAYVFPNIDTFKKACRDPEKIKTKIIILPTESIGGKEEHISRTAAKFLGNFPEENKRWYEVVSKFCIWGKNHFRVFTDFAPELESRVSLVGHPRMDIASNDIPLRSVKRRKKVGFLTRFSTFNDFEKRSMFDMIFLNRRNSYGGDEKVPLRYLKDPEKDIEHILFKDIGDFRVMTDLMVKLQEREFDLVLRIHPRENRFLWKSFLEKNDLKVEVCEWDEPFGHWVKNIDHLISPASTSFYDSYLAGKKPICTNLFSSMRELHVFNGDVDTGEMLNFAFMPKDFEELVEILGGSSKMDETPEKLKSILEFEVGYPECLTSHENLAQSISDALEGSKGSSSKVQRNIFTFVCRLFFFLQSFYKLKSEQGATFLLTKKRIKWIDNITGHIK